MCVWQECAFFQRAVSLGSRIQSLNPQQINITVERKQKQEWHAHVTTKTKAKPLLSLSLPLLFGFDCGFVGIRRSCHLFACFFFSNMGRVRCSNWVWLDIGLVLWCLKAAVKITTGMWQIYPPFDILFSLCFTH